MNDAARRAAGRPSTETRGDRAKASFVLHVDEGEVLASGAMIKVSPATDAEGIGVATQQFVGREGIPIHRHLGDEEVFWVHRGRGIFVLAEQRIPVREGSLVYISPGTWHGYDNEQEETLLVWAISPPHFVDLFRQLASGVEVPADQREKLFEAHGFEFRSQ